MFSGVTPRVQLRAIEDIAERRPRLCIIDPLPAVAFAGGLWVHPDAPRQVARLANRAATYTLLTEVHARRSDCTYTPLRRRTL